MQALNHPQRLVFRCEGAKDELENPRLMVIY